MVAIYLQLKSPLPRPIQKPVFVSGILTCHSVECPAYLLQKPCLSMRVNGLDLEKLFACLRIQNLCAWNSQVPDRHVEFKKGGTKNKYEVCCSGLLFLFLLSSTVSLLFSSIFSFKKYLSTLSLINLYTEGLYGYMYYEGTKFVVINFVIFYANAEV